MHRLNSIFIAILILLLAFGCSSSEDQDVSSGSGSVTETSFNFTMTSFLKQETAGTASDRQADFTVDQIMTGQLTVTPSAGGTAQVFDWSIYLDETSFDVQSNKTIILAPGTYDFSLLLIRGDQQYGGSALNRSISDGTFDVPMTIRPIIGDTVTDVSVVASLADFKFQYDPAELSAASLAVPQLGVTVDSGTEQIFAINPTTGISDNYINLSEGPHNIHLALYDGPIQRGRSIAEQESVIVSAGLNIAMDLVALHGETTFSLLEAGGNATFYFNIPAEVVDEAGDVSNLEVVFSMVGDDNPLEENLLSLTQAVSGDYEASIMLLNKQFGDVTLSLVFTDTSVTPEENLGTCNISTTLDTTERTMTCDVTLRRRAIVGGSLLATLGINVMNEASEPVAGAVVSEDGNILGITGSGAFGTAGYLKVYLNADDYTIHAESGPLSGESTVTLTPLAVENIDVQLTTTLQPALSDSGQTTCYDQSGTIISCPAPDNTLSQDGSYIGNPISFADNTDGTISDNNTLLVWQRAVDHVGRNWDDANLYCESLSLGGRDDWRLPTAKELQSLVDYGRSNPAIDSAYFPDTVATTDRYWSSTVVANYTGNAWIVLFNPGHVMYTGKSSNIYVRCVSEQSASNLCSLDYIDGGDGTVTHSPTGLMWQAEDNDSMMDWAGALHYCEDLLLAGYDDWRLPNIRELTSIVDFSAWGSSIQGSFFPNTNSARYWSSTSYDLNSTHSFSIHFIAGEVYVYHKSLNSGDYARCVRGGQ